MGATQSQTEEPRSEKQHRPCQAGLHRGVPLAPHGSNDARSKASITANKDKLQRSSAQFSLLAATHDDKAHPMHNRCCQLLPLNQGTQRLGAAVGSGTALLKGSLLGS